MLVGFSTTITERSRSVSKKDYFTLDKQAGWMDGGGKAAAAVQRFWNRKECDEGGRWASEKRRLLWYATTPRSETDVRWFVQLDKKGESFSRHRNLFMGKKKGKNFHSTRYLYLLWPPGIEPEIESNKTFFLPCSVPKKCTQCNSS